jgi:hypothetical protein
VFERVSEDRDEAGVGSWLASEVLGLVFAGEEDVNGVTECAAIVREDRWPAGIVEEDVR